MRIKIDQTKVVKFIKSNKLLEVQVLISTGSAQNAALVEETDPAEVGCDH